MRILNRAVDKQNHSCKFEADSLAEGLKSVLFIIIINSIKACRRSFFSFAP